MMRIFFFDERVFGNTRTSFRMIPRHFTTSIGGIYYIGVDIVSSFVT